MTTPLAMTPETKERLLKGGISVASLAAAYALAGEHTGPLKDLITIGAGVAGNWLAQFSSEAVLPIVKQKWLSNPNPHINHHVERALKDALDAALDDVKTRYISQRGSVSPREEQSLTDFIATLKERGARTFVDDVRRTMDDAEVFQYIAAKPADVGRLLDERLEVTPLLDPFSDDFYLTPDFIAFFKQHLPERMQFWFRETLKEGTEAKQAVDLLYFDTLRTLLETLVQEQPARQQLLDQLQQQVEKNYQQVEFYGEIWLSAIRQFRSQFDRLLDNDQQILRELRALGIDLGDLKNQLLNRSAADARVNLPADVQYQRLSSSLQQLTTDLAAKQQEADDLTADLRADLTPRVRDRLQKDLSDVNQTALRLGTERADTEKALKDHVAGVLRLANLLGRANDGSERLRQARALFEQGRIADVIALIDEDAIRRERDTERQKLTEATNRLKQLAQELLIKAEAIALDKTKPDWYAEASARYHEAVDTSDDPEISFAAAKFFYDHNEFDAASLFYEKTLIAYRRLDQQGPHAYRADIALALNNWGNVQSNAGNLLQAQASYQEALMIRRTLTEQESQTHEADLAMTINNWGLLHSDMGFLTQAQDNYIEALAIRRELARKNPHIYRAALAMTLNNLALLQNDTEPFIQAQINFSQCLTIYRDLTRDNSETYLPNLALALNNMGNLQNVLGQFDQAHECYIESLAIYRDLVRMNPQAHRPNLSLTLNNFAELQIKMKAWEQAYKSIEEALIIRRALTRQNSQAYSVDLAMTLANLSIYYSQNLLNRNLSIAYAREALQLAEPFKGQMVIADQLIEGCNKLIIDWDNR